jgi:Tol biopolymer transport system component
MALSSGTRLGPYEIQALAGAGGMGEVYKARDTRLDRTVAIKVLPESLAAGGQFRERFEREARVISQLDHPHICALHDVGEHDGRWYLVMQYLEGETLASRLARGPLPVGEVLTLGLQIAGALDKAHRAGVVHRDLKPGNIMLTRAGARLLDFGLAKTNVVAASGVSALPTTPQNITAQGTILGTFQYMAPEQVEGQETDARTDIFAFGAVLYEMATGRPAFQGKTQASLIGAILRDDPTTSLETAPIAPAALARVIKTCLAKNPDDRFQTMHDVALQLQWLVEGGSQAGAPAVTVVAKRSIMPRLAIGAAAVAVLVAAGVGAMVFMREEPAPRLMRFDLATPEGVVSVDAPRLSPDGRILAFNATGSDGLSRIWLRPLNSLAANPLPGTEGTTRPFWSPDSQFLGFFAEGRLKKIDVSGGPAQKVADAPTGADGSWSSEGVILFDGRANDPIYRVPAAGGVPSVAVAPDPARKETAVGWPEFLPDGRRFLYLAMGQSAEDNQYRIGSLESQETQTLTTAQTQVAYAPPGFLLFVRDRTLVAQRFDPDQAVLSGEPVPLAERVGTDSVGLARFSVSRDGSLAYRTGDAGNRLVWVDRSGRELEVVGDPAEHAAPALSGDGRRLAYRVNDPRSGKADIWVRDLVRGVSSRFTLSPGDNDVPLWSPDGATIVFGSEVAGVRNLFEKPANGQGEAKVLWENTDYKTAVDWSRDGRYVAVMARNSKTGFDVWALPMTGDRQPIAVVSTSFDEAVPKFAPNGRFLAYVTNESGRNEVYVQTFPVASGRWQVSNAGGGDPSWRADGRELYYRGVDQRMMAVDIEAGDLFQAGVPRPLFTASVVPGNARNKYVASADGQRFLLLAPLGRDSLAPTTLVLNWHAELAR